MNCEGPRRKTSNVKTTTEFIFSFHVEKIQEQFELHKRNNSNILHDHCMVLQPAYFFSQPQQINTGNGPRMKVFGLTKIPLLNHGEKVCV